MSWNFLDGFNVIFDVLELFSSGSGESCSTSDRKSLNYDEKPKKGFKKELNLFKP
jgi:hypothetical protein